MKAIGYVRVSTEGQATEGISLEAQQARIQAFCASQGWELARAFLDAGLSGSRADNRPGLQSALDAATAGSVLVVYSLSRLARSTKDAIAIAERLAKQGADLVSLSEKIDTTTAAGKMVFRMLAVLAEFERDQISERTKSALAHLKAKGRRVGGIPYGFSLRGRNLIRNEDEQTTIRMAVERREAGFSLRAVAALLDLNGRKARNGKSWSPKVLRDLLKLHGGKDGGEKEGRETQATGAARRQPDRQAAQREGLDADRTGEAHGD